MLLSLVGIKIFGVLSILVNTQSKHILKPVPWLADAEVLRASCQFYAPLEAMFLTIHL